MNLGLRFRTLQDYATRNGYVGGIPTYFNATYTGRVYGVILIPASTADFRDVSLIDMPIPSGADFGTWMRNAQDYAGKHQYLGAIPTFNAALTGGVTVHGLLLLKPGAAQWRDVSADDLGHPADTDIAGRFRAAQTYAATQKMVAACPNFYQATRALVNGRQMNFYGTLLFPPGTAEFRDVPVEQLVAGNFDDPEFRMRVVQQYAANNGFVGAFPTFFQADYGPGLVYGAVLVRGPGAVHRDVPASQLGNPPDGDDAALFRAVQSYAATQKLPGAFPTFYTAPNGDDTLHGVVLTDSSIAEWRDVPVATLGNPAPDDAGARFRAVQTYAVANKAVGGYPTFFEAPSPAGTVNGTILLRGSGVDFRDVPFNDLFNAAVIGAIRDKWNQLGGPTGFLGLPLTYELPCADGIGRYNQFEGGYIYFTPGGQCFEVGYGIYDAWSTVDREHGWLGYPVSDEGPWTSPDGRAGRISHFQQGSITWHPTLGATINPLVYTSPAAVISTPSGTALSGSVIATIRSDGTYSFAYQMHDSGAIAYDLTIHAAFTSQNGITLLDAYSGHVTGTVGKGSRDASQTNELPGPPDAQGKIHGLPCISKNFAAFSQGVLSVAKDYGPTGIPGALIDVAKAISQVSAGVVGGALGVIITSASVVGSILPSLGPGETFGVIEGVLVFNSGAGLFLAAIDGVAVTAITDALVAYRQLNDNEKRIATEVFRNTISFDRIRVTNLNITSGRPFTAPGADGLIYMNVGGANYADLSVAKGPYPNQGQLLIHELTHAWQIIHTGFLPGFVCEAVVTWNNNSVVNTDVYHVGPPGPAWSDFGIEAQAALVDQWYQRGCKETPDELYFPYIRDHIRAATT